MPVTGRAPRNAPKSEQQPLPLRHVSHIPTPTLTLFVSARARPTKRQRTPPHTQRVRKKKQHTASSTSKQNGHPRRSPWRRLRRHLGAARPPGPARAPGGDHARRLGRPPRGELDFCFLREPRGVVSLLSPHQRTPAKRSLAPCHSRCRARMRKTLDHPSHARTSDLEFHARPARACKGFCM